MKRIFLLALALVLLASCAAADGAMTAYAGVSGEDGSLYTADGSGDLSGYEEGFRDDEYEQEDPVEDALGDYDSVIRAFARAVLGMSWAQEDAGEALNLYGFDLEDVNGDGACELILYRTGAEGDEVCGLYGLDGEGKIVDLLPGLAPVYRYTLCTADDGDFVLRRMSEVGGGMPLETCAYYRLEGLKAAFIEGYIRQDGSYYRAQDDAPRVTGDAQQITGAEARDMAESYPPYLEEYWFTASVSEYFYVEGDMDAVSGWEE